VLFRSNGVLLALVLSSALPILGCGGDKADPTSQQTAPPRETAAAQGPPVSPSRIPPQAGPPVKLVTEAKRAREIAACLRRTDAEPTVAQIRSTGSGLERGFPGAPALSGPIVLVGTPPLMATIYPFAGAAEARVLTKDGGSSSPRRRVGTVVLEGPPQQQVRGAETKTFRTYRLEEVPEFPAIEGCVNATR
jgi:hypothetical protein